MSLCVCDHWHCGAMARLDLATDLTLLHLQRKVARSLLHGSKGGLKSLTAKSLPLLAVEINTNEHSDISPLSNDRRLAEISGMIEKNFPPLPPRKLKKQQINSQQVQDKRENDLEAKKRLSKAHKAAMVLYASKRAKEGGLSVRACEKIIKSKHHGIGPSYSTIYHYVVDLGCIGISPIKPGPEGNYPPNIYRALCAAFGSFMQINQVNSSGRDNSQTKMVPIIADVVNITCSAAGNLLRQLCQDTAMNMKANKLYFAEER
jgi:hypothetical protein